VRCSRRARACPGCAPDARAPPAQVVLVNGDTASTSEMLTGALHAAGRAVTAGAHTFGKGRTQRVVPMRDGSTLLVSASLLTTPAHERIDKARGASTRTRNQALKPFLHAARGG
jgi:hypothetical protein